MYKATGDLDKGFTTTAHTVKGGEYKMYMDYLDGPMDLFTVAFSGCIAMCVKGYYFRTYNIEDLKIRVRLNVDYDNRSVEANILVDRSEEELLADKSGILANIKKRCKISHLLTKDIEIVYNVHKYKQV